MAHTLIHWRFHLNEWVTGYLEFKGILDDEEILKRSRWSQGRKTKFADETLGMMIQTGEVQKLWRDFHINLKMARETTVRYAIRALHEICTDHMTRRAAGEHLLALLSLDLLQSREDRN